VTSTTSDRLTDLAARLTEPQDRQTYAALISYFNSLPEGDELFRLVELLGLLSLMGQRLPDALAELLVELRTQAKAAGEYHAQVDARLADFPAQIVEGVDVGAVAKGMSEAFRQQLAATALHDTAALLKAATVTIKQLSGEISASLKPAANEYRGITSTISTETAKLVTAARNVEEHNRRLILQQHSNHRVLLALAALVVFLLGGFAGIELEKRQTIDALATVGTPSERIQTPTLPIVEVPRKNKKEKGL
jgi:hypothetical protein